MTTKDLYTGQFKDMEDLLYGMYSRFTCNSPTKDVSPSTAYRADIAIDFLQIIYTDTPEFLWMERECGTNVGVPGDVTSVDYFFKEKPEGRYHVINKENFTIKQVDRDDFAALIDMFGRLFSMLGGIVCQWSNDFL